MDTTFLNHSVLSQFVQDFCAHFYGLFLSAFTGGGRGLTQDFQPLSSRSELRVDRTACKNWIAALRRVLKPRHLSVMLLSAEESTESRGIDCNRTTKLLLERSTFRSLRGAVYTSTPACRQLRGREPNQPTPSTWFHVLYRAVAMGGGRAEGSEKSTSSCIALAFPRSPATSTSGQTRFVSRSCAFSLRKRTYAN